MAKRTIDRRMFCEVKSLGLWVSHREYKTSSGARALITKLCKTHELPYFLVQTRQYSYRPVRDADAEVYRVAVKAADIG